MPDSTFHPRDKDGKILREISLPKDETQYVVPEGYKLGMYRGQVAMIPDGFYEAQAEQKAIEKATRQATPGGKGKRNTLATWGKRNMQGWVKNELGNSQKILQNSSIAIIVLDKKLDRYIVEVDGKRLTGPDKEGSYYYMAEAKAAAEATSTVQEGTK